MKPNKYKIINKSGQLLYLHLSDGKSIPLESGGRRLVDEALMSGPVRVLESKGDIKVEYLPIHKCRKMPPSLLTAKRKFTAPVKETLEVKGPIEVKEPSKKTRSSKEGGK